MAIVNHSVIYLYIHVTATGVIMNRRLSVTGSDDQRALAQRYKSTEGLSGLESGDRCGDARVHLIATTWDVRSSRRPGAVLRWTYWPSRMRAAVGFQGQRSMRFNITQRSVAIAVYMCACKTVERGRPSSRLPRPGVCDMESLRRIESRPRYPPNAQRSVGNQIVADQISRASGC